MKAWWEKLSAREKQTMSVGSIIIMGILFYIFIWTSLHDRVLLLRTKAKNNQQLLAWMQAVDTKIQTIEKNQKHVFNTSSSLQSLIQTQINQSQIATFLSQLQQTEDGSVQLTFKQIDFDSMMTWLITAWKTQGWRITQMTVTAINNPGMVSVELKISAK